MSRAKREEIRKPIDLPDVPNITEAEGPDWITYFNQMNLKPDASGSGASCNCYCCKANRLYFRQYWLPAWKKIQAAEHQNQANN